MFAFTPAAAQQIKETAIDTGTQAMALRIAARMGDDGTAEYGMGFDDPSDEDIKLNLDGITVIIAPDSQPLLNNTVLDYIQISPDEFNFIFMDAGDSACGSSSCGGCGCPGTAH